LEFTEEEIIAGIRNRQNDVFKYLDKKMRRVVRLKVKYNRGTYEDGDDCYNDSIIILMKMVDRHDFKHTCKISSLLGNIAEKQWLQKLDKRGPANTYKIRHNEEIITEQDVEELDKPLHNKIFDECCSKLGRECRQILKAYMKGMSGKEMAELFDYEPTTIRKKKCICHATLRELVHNHPDYIKIKKDEDIK